MANYKEIKGFHVQSQSTDPAASSMAAGSWASGGTMNTARKINGGSAGTHTVSGIKTTDELISVLEQNGTSGILTDLTTEFSIVKADTIANPGGTATSSDKLIVMYLSK